MVAYSNDHSRHHMTPPESSPATIAPGDQFLREKAVLKLIAMGHTAWRDRVREGKAPPPIKIGSASVWLRSEVTAWMAERVRESRGA